MKLRHAVGGTAAAILLTTGASMTSAAAATQPDVMHPASATKCGSVYCIYVDGSGLYVNFVTVRRANSGDTITGYVYGKDDNDGYIKWSGHESGAGSVKLTINHSFSDGSWFCAGAAPQQVNASYSSEVCATIHS